MDLRKDPYSYNNALNKRIKTDFGSNMQDDNNRYYMATANGLPTDNSKYLKFQQIHNVIPNEYTNNTNNNNANTGGGMNMNMNMGMNMSMGVTMNGNENQNMMQIPSDDHNLNYYQEYCRLFIANMVLTSQMKELVAEKNELLAKLAKLQEKSEELNGNKTQFENTEERKRFRRTASEVARHYRCPVESCQKSYGSEGSLNQHVKLKHPDSMSLLTQIKISKGSSNNGGGSSIIASGAGDGGASNGEAGDGGDGDGDDGREDGMSS